MDVHECLNAYYSDYDEDSRLTSRHGQVEYLTTLAYVDRYLKDGMRVLEIGAGTGRYSHALARRGFYVDAVELIAHNIEVFDKNTQPGEHITIRRGNATDLHFIEDDAYDIVLLLGPMYHLFTREDAERALSEALRVLKRGGVLFCAYCVSDLSILGYGFKDGQIFSLIEKGLVDTQHFRTRSTPSELFQLYRKEEIFDLTSNLFVKRLHYVAADLLTAFIRDAVDQMDDATFEMFMRYHLSVCERDDLVGATSHSLDILRKG